MNAVCIGSERLRSTGIPVRGLPKVRPKRKACSLLVLITKAGSGEFVVLADDDFTYYSYREKTKRAGDRGSWIFEKMELFFVPAGSVGGV